MLNNNWYCIECNFVISDTQRELAIVDFACVHCGETNYSDYYQEGSLTHEKILKGEIKQNNPNKLSVPIGE